MVPPNFSPGCAAFAFLLITAFFCHAGVLSCPDKCECKEVSQTELSIDCSGRNLSVVPLYSGPEGITVVLVLDMQNNEITEINAGDFQSYPQINVLHLANNKLTSIPQAVSNLTSVKALLLQGNNFGDSIPENAFQKLTWLQMLYLSDCGITSLPDDVFGGNLTNLLTLDISGNLLNDIPTGALKSLNSVTDVSLERNKFKSITTGAFSGMQSLESVGLSENPIEKIETNAFSHENLQTVRLLNCQISTLSPGAFSGLPTLFKLVMFSNEIKVLAGSGIEQLSNLTSLVISYNQLENLPDNFFDTLSNIDEIDFAANAMTDFPVSSLANVTQGRTLQKLDLSQNPLPCSLKAKIESAVDIEVLHFPYGCNASTNILSSNSYFLMALAFLNIFDNLVQR